MIIGRTDDEAETPILWPPDAKSWLIGKDPDAGKDWGQEEKGTIEDEMVGWHHWLNGHGFGWTPGGLACCSLWGRKESDMTERLNWTERMHVCMCAKSLQLYPILCNPIDCSMPGFPASLSPGVCSNSCPLIQWCHPTISSSVAPFSSCPQSFPASRSFPLSQLFTSGGQSIGVSTPISPLKEY